MKQVRFFFWGGGFGFGFSQGRVRVRALGGGGGSGSGSARVPYGGSVIQEICIVLLMKIQLQSLRNFEKGAFLSQIVHPNFSTEFLVFHFVHHAMKGAQKKTVGNFMQILLFQCLPLEISEIRLCASKPAMLKNTTESNFPTAMVNAMATAKRYGEGPEVLVFPRKWQGLAPSAFWRATPSSPRQLGGPFSQATALPSPPPLPPTRPGSFYDVSGGAAWVGVGEAAHGGGGGGPSKRHLGPDPHLGVRYGKCKETKKLRQ